MHTLLEARRGESSRDERQTPSIEERVHLETDKSVRVDRLIENFFFQPPKRDIHKVKGAGNSPTTLRILNAGDFLD